MKGFDLNVLINMIGNAVGGTVKEYFEELASPIEKENKELIDKVNYLEKESKDIKRIKSKIEEENKELKGKNNKLSKDNEAIIRESNEILDENEELKCKNNKLEKEYEVLNKDNEVLRKDNEALNKLLNQTKVELAKVSKYGIVALNEEIYKIMVTEYRNERNDSNRRKKIVNRLMSIIADNNWKFQKANITTLVDTKGLCAIFTEEQCGIIKREMGRI
ncbi:MAG: hypothetical protein ACI3T9_02885 [Romboutsia timonensis]